MENFLHITFIWLHILGVALFVGPQFFLALAWVPASRQITDPKQRVAAIRVVTRRFGYIGGAGIVLLVLAGGYLIGDWRDYYGVPDDVGFTDLRFGVVFIIKMTLLLVMLAVVAYHMLYLGPKQLEAMEAQANGERITDAEVKRARMMSMAASIIGLLLALTLMVMGVMLNSVSWSLQEF
ncbi:MAG: hypothetical protein AB7J35_18775 [Dehalococcoidia bacterium]